MNKLVGIVMMSAFNAAWSLLKSQPVDESGKTFNPAELQKLRAFVNQHIESPDPAMRKQAEEMYQMLTDAMSGAYGQGDGPPGLEGEKEPEAPSTPWYSSTDRGYNPDKEDFTGAPFPPPGPKGVGVSKPMPSDASRTDSQPKIDRVGVKKPPEDEDEETR